MFLDGRRDGVDVNGVGGIYCDGLEVKTSGDGNLPVANATEGRTVVMWGGVNVAKCVLGSFVMR